MKNQTLRTNSPENGSVVGLDYVAQVLGEKPDEIIRALNYGTINLKPLPSCDGEIRFKKSQFWKWAVPAELINDSTGLLVEIPAQNSVICL